AQIGNDRPAIGYNDVWAVSHHGVFAVGDRIENFAVRHLADSFILKRNHGREAVLFGDPVTRCSGAMTHRASDIETLLAALHQLTRDGSWNACSPVIAHFAGVVVINAGAKTRMRMRPRTDCGCQRLDALRLRHLITNRNRAGNRQTWAA